jgi:hypothetical protein
MKMTQSARRILALTFCAALMLCPAMRLRAQTSGSGTINGTVTDSSGAVVASAAVVVTDTDTGVSRTVATNEVGSYVASFLQPGHYEVVLGGGNFGKVDRKNLVLTVGQTLTVDAALTIGATATEVTVISESPILDTQKMEVSQTLDTNLIASLPVATRNWSAFVLLTPNVVQDGGSGLVSFHGISGLYNQNYVDGANNNQILFSEARGRASGAPYIYSVDSIKEFQAETSNYSVEFGQAAGGQVNAITKSGTNAIHGDVFYSLRYPTLNALDPYSKFQALHNNGNPFLLTQPTHQQHQFGGSVGGPLIKDKLFYFFTYDGSRKVNPVTYTSSSRFPLSCPSQLNGTQCSAANAFLSAQLGQFPRATDQDLGFGKLDYQVTPSNHLSTSFDLMDYHAPNAYSPNPSYNNLSVTANGTNVTHERIFVANWDSAIRSTVVNNLRFQWGQDLEITGANAPGPSVGIASVMSYGLANALPRRHFPTSTATRFRIRYRQCAAAIP